MSVWNWPNCSWHRAESSLFFCPLFSGLGDFSGSTFNFILIANEAPCSHFPFHQFLIINDALHFDGSVCSGHFKYVAFCVWHLHLASCLKFNHVVTCFSPFFLVGKCLFIYEYLDLHIHDNFLYVLIFISLEGVLRISRGIGQPCVSPFWAVILFAKVVVSFCIPTRNVWGFQFLHRLASTAYYSSLGSELFSRAWSGMFLWFCVNWGTGESVGGGRWLCSLTLVPRLWKWCKPPPGVGFSTCMVSVWVPNPEGTILTLQWMGFAYLWVN